jgi:ABC-type multidrug transport system permease subunit
LSALIDRLKKLPLAYFLAGPIALGVVVFVTMPTGVISADPTSGISMAIFILSFGGVAQALVSIFAASWWRFVGQTWLVHGILMLALTVFAVLRFNDAGPALMALMMPILFPGLAFGLAGVVRFVVSLFRR